MTDQQREVTDETAKKMEAFLEALAEVGSVRHAAEASGMNRTMAYAIRATHEGFAARWKDALADSADVLEQEARRRAMTGHSEPVVYQGKLQYLLDDKGEVMKGADGKPIPLTINKFSDMLLLALLNANNPDKFKYRSEVKQTKGDEKEETPIEQLTDAQLRDLIERAGDALDRLGRGSTGRVGDGEKDGGKGTSAPVH